MSQSPEWTGQHRESSRGGRSYHDGLMSMQGKEEARRRGSQSPEHKRRRMVEERRRRSTSRDSKCREARVRMRQGPLRHEAHLNRWDSRTGDADENGHDDSQDRRSHHHHHGHDGRNSRGPESSHRRRRQHRREATGVELPFGVRQLSKKDFETFGPLFTHYLAVQKQKQVQGMDERELRGRWKSFVGRWNRGELAEGWYDPDMFARIAEWTPEPQLMELDESDGGEGQRDATEGDKVADARVKPRNSDLDGRQINDESEDDEFGPPLPQGGHGQVGAQIPSFQDLSLRNELIAESREAERAELRAARKADRALQKERLEEAAPRADAGTHERRMERRREAGERLRQAREDKSPGMEDAGGADVLGGGDSAAEYRQMRQCERRRRSERQVRREEFERARREELEMKRRVWREREEGTVSMLRELARQRFG